MLLASALLALAIALEVAATAVLPRAAGFTHLGWSAVVLAGYGGSIWLLAVVVRYLPVSAVYAIWAGVGTAAVAVVGAAWLQEPVTTLKVLSIGLIICGVVLLNVGTPQASA